HDGRGRDRGRRHERFVGRGHRARVAQGRGGRVRVRGWHGGEPGDVQGVAHSAVHRRGGHVKKALRAGVFAIALAFALKPALALLATARSTLDIYFIDVEGGQSTLIVTPARE